MGDVSFKFLFISDFIHEQFKAILKQDNYFRIYCIGMRA